MVKHVFLAAGLVGTGMASLAYMKEQVEAMKSAFRSTNPQFLQITGETDDDGVEISTGIWQGYGCWCHFDNDPNQDHPQIRGTPVDTYDSFCKDYHRGIKCSQILSRPNCDPLTKEYNPIAGSLIVPLTPTEIRTQCNDNNPGDPCAKDICAVEMMFVNNMRGEFFGASPAPVVTGNFLENTDFDTMCPVPAQFITQSIACCGQFPIRYPYDANRAGCCGGGFGANVYNQLTHECCNGAGAVALLGQC